MSEQINPIERRMATMMMVIDTAIQCAETPEDQLMLACAMMQRTKEIFDCILGEEGTKRMIKELIKDE
jgi:hypothetical protein